MVCVPSGKKPRKGCRETNFGPNPWNYPRYPLSVLQYFHFPIWIWFRRCQDAPPKPRQVQWVRKSMKSPKSRQWFAMQFSHSFLHSNLPHLQIGKKVTKMTHLKWESTTKMRLFWSIFKYLSLCMISSNISNPDQVLCSTNHFDHEAEVFLSNYFFYFFFPLNLSLERQPKTVIWSKKIHELLCREARLISFHIIIADVIDFVGLWAEGSSTRYSWKFPLTSDKRRPYTRLKPCMWKGNKASSSLATLDFFFYYVGKLPLVDDLFACV